MKATLKFGTYRTPEEVAKAVNERIYCVPGRTLVQITLVSDSYPGSSNTTYIVWYNEDE